MMVGFADSISQYLFLLGIAALALLIALILVIVFRRSGQNMYIALLSRLSLLTAMLILLLVIASEQRSQQLQAREVSHFLTTSNLIAAPLFPEQGNSFIGWAVNGGKPSRIAHFGGDMFFWPSLILPSPRASTTSTVSTPLSGDTNTTTSLDSSLIPIQPLALYRYSLRLCSPGNEYSDAQAQVRIVWLDSSLNVISWNDSPIWRLNYTSTSEKYDIQDHVAPGGARFARMQIKNFGPGSVLVSIPKFSALSVHVEPNPNATSGSLAFSFDWESAMGGAIHSKGATQHDAQPAAIHGLEMRQGANWLISLFKKNNIKATFYATGYNLLDGNTEKRTFSGDPIYKWASPKNRWGSDWWLTHKWFGDDPFGTYQTQPAWYFGDQTRTLLAAGDEIASHTFAHIYVRGSNPEELATDMDEWLKVAQAQGITGTTTFAFPWRSSNSLKADFYDVLYKRGIRAVTRLYTGDLKDLYTVSAVPVYPALSVMPDFLLGAPSVNAGEEAAGGSIIGADRGLEVITETIARRGTTSFWTHPEQLADGPTFAGVRAAWQRVVDEAVAQRGSGKLWIGTVADITAYQCDVMSVTTTLEPGFLRLGGWKIQVRNDSGKELHGVTLTLPGDVQRASAPVDIQTVYHPPDGSTMLAAPGKPIYPARQLVLPRLPPGTTTIDVDWVSGQEPLE